MSSGARPWIGLPSKSISPDRTWVRPEILRTSVLLPAPFGPSRPTIAPAGTDIDTSRKTSIRP